MTSTKFKLTALDSRGRETVTLFFVRVTWLVMLIKYALSGIIIADVVSTPAIEIENFGAAVSMVLLIWLGREWTEKHKPNEESQDG